MSFITTDATRIHWNGTDAYWHAGTKTLKYASDTGAWTQVATTTVNESIYNQTCFDHLGGKLYWRAASEDFLRIYTLSTGLWTTSSTAGLSLPANVAIAWHPHLHDDFSGKHRARSSEFNRGVVIYEPTKVHTYNPSTDTFTTRQSNGSNYDGSGALSAVYVRALDAVVFGGGTGGSGKIYRLKHATSGTELISTAAQTPMNFGASSALALMMDDPTGNGLLLLSRSSFAAYRWWSPNNTAASGAWTTLSNHPFVAPFVACSVETDYVVMGVSEPVSASADPVVRLWKPADGVIPRYRTV